VKEVEMALGRWVDIGVEIVIGPEELLLVRAKPWRRTTYAIAKRGESVRHLFILHIMERYR
jgi:hypothetical protein